MGLLNDLLMDRLAEIKSKLQKPELALAGMETADMSILYSDASSYSGLGDCDCGVGECDCDGSYMR